MEKMVIELITFLQKWGLWQDVIILTDGKAYSYSCNKEDVCFGLTNVKISACENPEDYATGPISDCEDNLKWCTYSNPEHILDMVFEGPLYMLLLYNTYEGIKKKDISPEGWDYIFAHTDILEEYLYDNFECLSPEELLDKILEDKFDNPDYTAWDPLAFDTWEEYQNLVNGESYPDGEEKLTPNYQRYGTYQEYLDDLELSEKLSVEDIKPLWEKILSDAKKGFVSGKEGDETVSIPEIAGFLFSEFSNIFDRHGLWFDFGFLWSLTCYRK